MAYRQIERIEQALCETDDFDSMLSGLCSQNRFSCLDERVRIVTEMNGKMRRYINGGGKTQVV